MVADISKTASEGASVVLPISSPAASGASSNAPKQAVAIEPFSGAGDDEQHLNTDERERLQWQSRYPDEARKSIRVDAVYVATVFILTLVALLLTWRGTTFQLLVGDCKACSQASLDRYAYFFLGGQLGGTLFGLKYLYNVVARGWWNIDRRLWRILSPFLSGGLALAVGALVDSGILGLTTKANSGASYFSLGFVAGYFADSALRKMKEVADTIFGSPEHHTGHRT